MANDQRSGLSAKNRQISLDERRAISATVAILVMVIVTVVLAGLTLTPIGTPPQARVVVPTADQYPRMSRRAWLSKVTEAARAGQGVTIEEEAYIESLLTLPDEQFSQDAYIDRLFADPRIADAVLDFNLFFLGKDQGPVVERRYSTGEVSYSEYALAYTGAVHSAIQVLPGGSNYLSFFDWEIPIYLAPLSKPGVKEPNRAPLNSTGLDLTTGLKRMDYRQSRLNKILDEIDTIQDWLADKDFRSNRQEICTHPDYTPGLVLVNEPGPSLGSVIRRHYYSFIGILLAELGVHLDTRDRFSFDEKGWQLYDYCEGRIELDLVAELEQIKELVQWMFDAVVEADPEDYTIHHLGSLITMNPWEFKLSGSDRVAARLARTPDRMFSTGLENSTGNRNFSKAKYVYKHFYCRDYTPIGFPDVQQHTKNLHAADPACQTCHYSLDRTGGFFMGFVTPLADNRVQLASVEIVDKAEWEDFWRLPDGGWEVAVVRAPHVPEENDYLRDPERPIEDLYRIIRESSEVKACLVQRMAEKFLGQGVTIDGSFLEELTEDFIEKSEAGDSSGGFKTVLRRLFKSNTFWHPRPETGQCYDFGQDVDHLTRPPCAVAHALKSTCATGGCHDSVNHEKHSLDLSKWVKVDEQGGFGFAHLDRSGEQKERLLTLRLMQRRLRSNNPNFMMPPPTHLFEGAANDTNRNKIFDEADKAAIDAWITKELQHAE